MSQAKKNKKQTTGQLTLFSLNLFLEKKATVPFFFAGALCLTTHD